MKLLFKAFKFLVVLLVVLIAVAYLLPRTYHVERSIEIKATPLDVYEKLVDHRQWKAWGVWYQRDPDMKLTYSDPSSGVGSWSQWTSRSEGDGKMTFTIAVPLHKVAYTMEFPAMNMKAEGYLQLNAGPGAVQVVWVGDGDLGLNPLYRWMGLLMDRMLGGDFEKSLARLKTVVEAPK